MNESAPELYNFKVINFHSSYIFASLPLSPNVIRKNIRADTCDTRRHFRGGMPKQKSPGAMPGLPLSGWRRPTFPQLNAVSSALRGLTSLFGMGRGGPPRYSHHASLDMSLTWYRKKDTRNRDRLARAIIHVTLQVTQSFRAISTARLNASLRLHLRPIDVVVSHDPYRKSHLEVGFALRCFQRLSRPNAATLRCGWRHNRYTGGSSIPVLSY